MASLESLSLKGKSIIDWIHPVGSLLFTSSNEDPSTIFEGTSWKRIKGRMIIGVDEDDSDFKSSGLTGGEKSHTLTVEEMPNHNHSLYIEGTIINKARSYMQQGNASFWNMSVGYEGNYSFGINATGGKSSQQLISLHYLLYLGKSCLDHLYQAFLINVKEVWCNG